MRLAIAIILVVMAGCTTPTPAPADEAAVVETPSPPLANDTAPQALPDPRNGTTVPFDAPIVGAADEWVIVYDRFEEPIGDGELRWNATFTAPGAQHALVDPRNLVDMDDDGPDWHPANSGTRSIILHGSEAQQVSRAGSSVWSGFADVRGLFHAFGADAAWEATYTGTPTGASIIERTVWRGNDLTFLIADPDSDVATSRYRLDGTLENGWVLVEPVLPELYGNAVFNGDLDGTMCEDSRLAGRSWMGAISGFGLNGTWSAEFALTGNIEPGGLHAAIMPLGDLRFPPELQPGMTCG